MVLFENQDSKPFKDVSKNGKDRKWRKRKLSNIELGDILDDLEYKTAERVLMCAEVLKFKEQADGTNKLYQTYFCKNKLCSICNWRRSMKYAYQAEQVINQAVEHYPKGRFLFLTLTVKNVVGKELNKSISEMGRAFNRLMKYKKIDKNILGYLRATEVTYSSERNDYHPHLHVLLFVNSSYFKGGNYISQEEWTNFWVKAMKLDYTPIVDIQAVKDKNGRGLKKAILETAKYPVKPFDVFKDDDNNVIVLDYHTKKRVVDDMLNGLYRKRQIGFGKLFKNIKKELELDDIEDGDLIQTGEEKDAESTGKEIVAVWNWQRMNYFVK